MKPVELAEDVSRVPKWWCDIGEGHGVFVLYVPGDADL
jgi:hypothetical protein